MLVLLHRTRGSTKGCSLALVRLCLTVSCFLVCSQHRKCVRPCILGLCSIRVHSFLLSKLFKSLPGATEMYLVYLAIIFAVQRLPQPPCLRQKFNKVGERKKDDGEMASSTSKCSTGESVLMAPVSLMRVQQQWTRIMEYKGNLTPTLHS